MQFTTKGLELLQGLSSCQLTAAQLLTIPLGTSSGEGSQWDLTHLQALLSNVLQHSQAAEACHFDISTVVRPCCIVCHAVTAEELELLTPAHLRNMPLATFDRTRLQALLDAITAKGAQLLSEHRTLSKEVRDYADKVVWAGSVTGKAVQEMQAKLADELLQHEVGNRFLDVTGKLLEQAKRQVGVCFTVVCGFEFTFVLWQMSYCSISFLDVTGKLVEEETVRCVCACVTLLCIYSMIKILMLKPSMLIVAAI